MPRCTLMHAPNVSKPFEENSLKPPVLKRTSIGYFFPVLIALVRWHQGRAASKGFGRTGENHQHRDEEALTSECVLL